MRAINVKALSILLLLYSVALLSSIAVLEMISVLLTVVALGLIIRDKWTGQFRWHLKKDVLNLSILSFNVVVLLSLLFSPVEAIRWDWGLAIFKMSLWYVALSYLMTFYLDKRRFESWFNIWVFAILVTSVYTIFQFFTGTDFIRGEGSILPYGPYFRPHGFFSMSLTLAYCLGMATMALLPAIQLKKGSFPKQCLMALFFVIAAAGVVLSLSRGAWGGMIFSSFVLLLFIRSKPLNILLGLCFVMFVAVLIFNPTVHEKMMILFDPKTPSNYFRLTLWHAYWEMFKDHFFLGVGWQQNEFVLDKYILQLGYDDFEFRSHAHSNFMQVASCLGLLGLMSFFGIILGVFKKCYGLMRNSTQPIFFFVGLSILGSQIFFHIGGLTECNFTDAEVSHMVFAQWAVLSTFTQWKSNVE